MRGHVHPAECDGLGEMSGPVPETLTSIHNKTGWNLLFWGGGVVPGGIFFRPKGKHENRVEKVGIRVQATRELRINLFPLQAIPIDLESFTRSKSSYLRGAISSEAIPDHLFVYRSKRPTPAFNFSRGGLSPSLLSFSLSLSHSLSLEPGEYSPIIQPRVSFPRS